MLAKILLWMKYLIPQKTAGKWFHLLLVGQSTIETSIGEIKTLRHDTHISRESCWEKVGLMCRKCLQICQSNTTPLAKTFFAGVFYIF